MRTSLRDIQTIEEYLSGKLSGTELISFTARLLTDPNFEMAVENQKETVIRRRP